MEAFTTSPCNHQPPWYLELLFLSITKQLVTSSIYTMRKYYLMKLTPSSITPSVVTFSFPLTHSPLSWPQTPMRIYFLSTACDVISFDCQGWLCPLTCAEWRDLSNHTKVSTIQSRTPEKEARNLVTLTWRFPWKSCSTTHLPFLSSNPEILKAFLKLFPPKWSLLNAQQ